MNPKQKRIVRIVCFVLVLLMVLSVAYLGVSLIVAAV